MATGHTEHMYGVPNRMIKYTRNPDVLYDLFYIKGDVPDAGAYITGEKKFSINIKSQDAPPCTQILLQFEHIPFPETTESSRQMDPALFKAYPKNRHSRYLATIPVITNPRVSPERIEFEFLDRPDESVADNAVNAVVIMIAPGDKSPSTYYMHSLDSYNKCSSNGGENCIESPVKSCPAKYVTVEGTPTSNRLLQSEPDCSDCENPACFGLADCVIDMSGLTEVEPSLVDPTTQEVTATINNITGSAGQETASGADNESTSEGAANEISESSAKSSVFSYAKASIAGLLVASFAL